MKPTVKVDYRNILVMARELSRLSPLPYKQILLLETASIIKIAALSARVASLQKIRESVERSGKKLFVEPGGTAVSVVNTKQNAGRIWFAYYSSGGRIRNVGAFIIFQTGGAKGWHVPDHVWQDYQTLLGYRDQAMKLRYKALVARRGMQRLSWFQISDQLGVALSSVSPNGSLQEGVVRQARGPRGRVYANGTATVNATTTALIITVRNQSPLAIKNQGQPGLDRAVAQRLKGFEIAMKKGVLTDLKARASRWKGIFVTA